MLASARSATLGENLQHAVPIVNACGDLCLLHDYFAKAIARKRLILCAMGEIGLVGRTMKVSEKKSKGKCCLLRHKSLTLRPLN